MATVALKNGKWYAVFRVKDSNGKLVQRWVSTGLPERGNKKKAQKIANDLQEEYGRKQINPYDGIMVSEYFERWLEQSKVDVRPKTYSTYAGNMRNHIIPYFKERRILLKKLRPIDLEDYYHFKMAPDSRMDGEGMLSTTTIKHHHQVISKALNDAVRRGLIPVNPAAVARTPKAERYKANYLNSEQIARMLGLFKGNTAELPITLCAFYGMRRSEVCGLQWKYVDFVQRTITIAVTMQQGSGGCYLANTKTDSSYRTLPMMNEVYRILTEQKLRQEKNRKLLGSVYDVNDFVCTWDDGHPIAPDYITREFHKVIRNSGLPQVRLHDLRHSVASILLNNGKSATDVADWMGHSSPVTTFGYYAHASKASKTDISK